MRSREMAARGPADRMPLSHDQSSTNRQRIDTLGLYGPSHYERDDAGGLWVPFLKGTYEIKESLKEMGFRCRYSESVWELPAAKVEEDTERRLRHLMECGELPPPAPAAPPAAEAAQPPATPAAAAAAAAAGTPLQRRERRRPRDDEGGADELPAPVVFHDCITMQQEADGRVLLEGSKLRRIAPMLESILHFWRLEQAEGPPRWRSDRPLSDAEREFVAAVLEHRRERLLYKVDDKAPIPDDWVVPPHFRPRDSEGFVLRGPYKTRNGMPHNLGRQFFSNFKQGDDSCFAWADGTEAFSAAAGDRFLDWAQQAGVPAFLFHVGGM